MQTTKSIKGQRSNELFNDRWLMFFGILLAGIGFPILFGINSNNSSFYFVLITSVLVTAISWWLSRRFGLILWKRFPWSKSPILHILIVIAYILVFTTLIIGLVFLINLLVDGPTTDYWQRNKNFHLVILLVFVFSVLIHEAVNLFFLWKKELTRVADLEKESIQSKFDALKNQVNPHFLFNSLGTLSSLINTDQQKAVEYVNEFSKTYRYLLEVDNNQIVTLAEELAFVESYVFLQKIRYADGFVFNMNIDPRLYSAYVLPLSLQMLVENALKHNTTSSASPLVISLVSDAERMVLLMKNNLQPRPIGNSTKIGLKNLELRYAGFAGKSISVLETDDEFIVEIPIIISE